MANVTFITGNQFKADYLAKYYEQAKQTGGTIL